MNDGHWVDTMRQVKVKVEVNRIRRFTVAVIGIGMVSILLVQAIDRSYAQDNREIVFEFTGVVTEIENLGNLNPDRITDRYRFLPGDRFEGSYSFDPDTKEIDGLNETIARYMGAVKKFSIRFDRNEWWGSGTNDDSTRLLNRIYVENDHFDPDTGFNRDVYTMSTQGVYGPNVLTFFGGPEGEPRSLDIAFIDSSGTAFASDELPLNPPSVGGFDTNIFRLLFGAGGDGIAVNGRIDSLTVHVPVSDSDNDGLPDEWELYGYPPGGRGTDGFVDLPAMGASPWHKDIFVEVGCAPGMCPSRQTLEIVRRSFANVPNEFAKNPDGVDGVSIHIDAGDESTMRIDEWDRPLSWRFGSRDGKTLSRSSSIGIPLDIGDPSQAHGTRFTFDPEAEAFNQRLLADTVAAVERNLDENRRQIFRYALFVARYHQASIGRQCLYEVNSRSSGFSIKGTPIFLIAMQSKADDPDRQWPILDSLAAAGTFLHELGHTLGLLHGGNDDFNYKPHYFSIMNYAFQFRGLPVRPGAPDSGVSRFGYSVMREAQPSTLPVLNELDLNELEGFKNTILNSNYSKTYYFCPADIEDNDLNPRSIGLDAVWIDWNCDDEFDASVGNANINSDTDWTGTECIDVRTPDLKAPVDWDYIDFRLLGVSGGGASYDLPADATPTEIASFEAPRVVPDLDVYVWGSRSVSILDQATLEVFVRNDGKEADSYGVQANSLNGRVAVSVTPNSVSLDAGASAIITMNLSANNSGAGNSDTVDVSVTSHTDSSVVRFHEVEVELLQGFAPGADAGADQRANEGDIVSLDASMSSDPDGIISSYRWMQISGPNVTLSSVDTATTSFVAPQVSAATTISFELTVTDDSGLSATDQVSVIVDNVQQSAPPRKSGGGGTVSWALLALFALFHLALRVDRKPSELSER